MTLPQLRIERLRRSHAPRYHDELGALTYRQSGPDHEGVAMQLTARLVLRGGASWLNLMMRLRRRPPREAQSLHHVLHDHLSFAYQSKT